MIQLVANHLHMDVQQIPGMHISSWNPNDKSSSCFLRKISSPNFNPAAVFAGWKGSGWTSRTLQLDGVRYAQNLPWSFGGFFVVQIEEVGWP